MRPKLAVIGSGAAALGVLAGLLGQRADFDITIFDIAKPVAEPPLAENLSPEWASGFYDAVYRKLWSLYSYKFPPPKTHFGEQIARQSVGGQLQVFKSESLGGLTNYWGGTMLPFTERELAPWPILGETLNPYYEQIAELVGLAAKPDALNEYFGRDYSTRPPIQLITMLDKLNQVVNSNNSNGRFKIVSGLNRCAIETRENQSNSCVYCGECMAGCFRDAVYSTRSTIQQYLKDLRVTRFVKGRVKRIGEITRSIEVETDHGCQHETGFSKVFLCAGCLASTEILMRSIGINSGPVMKDNAVYVFPILYMDSTSRKERNEPYLSLCNLIFGCLPKMADDHFAQAQIYPTFDYMWRYNIPPQLWPIFRPVMGLLRAHLFWGRLYIHSNLSQAYSIELKDNKVVMEEARKAIKSEYMETLMSDIRAAANKQGFHIPSISPFQQKTNSHYAGTLPFGGNLINVPATNEVMPGVYLCDSACFPESPAVSPTFTIMANACRVATESTHV